jgi:hypothetical protein
MELGILFDIDDLGGGFYGFEAWKIFLKHCDPEKLSGCIFYEGDTIDTLEGRANTFCIAVQSRDPTAVNYLKQTFAGLKEKGLLPPDERFAEGTVTTMHPLVLKAQVDTEGRFVTESWTKVDEELCEASGWQYAPKKTKPDVVGGPTSVAVPPPPSGPPSGSPPPSLEKEGRRPTKMKLYGPIEGTKKTIENFKKITPLGWAILAIFMVILFGGFFLLAPYFEIFFWSMDIASWLGVMIGFFIWYFIVAGMFIVVLKLDKEKLFRKG